jgi:PAS domain S-box-containing protein
LSSLPSFLENGGNLGRLIAARDWTDSLGPIETWPDSLRTAVGLLIHSPVPIVLLWGEDGIMIYNDAYSEFAGDRHPTLLGSKVREGWAEIADFNDNVMKVGLAGGTLSYKDQQLTLYRASRPETAWLDLFYSPVFAENGRPGGVIAVVIETTDRVMAGRATRENERRLGFLDALSIEVAKVQDADQVMAITTRKVAEHLGATNCAYADMDVDQDGLTIRGDWAAAGSPTIVGHYSLAAFGSRAVKTLRAGVPLIIHDNQREIAPEEAAAFQNIGIAATVCMPLVKEGRLTALMAVNDFKPRRWKPYDLALIREVTERSWAHVERVRAEAELRASEDNFRSLTRVLPNHVWTARPDGQLDWFNERVYEYSGVAEGALSGDKWRALVHPDDLPTVASRWASALMTGEPHPAELRLRRADGEWRWYLARAVPIKDAAGLIVRWIGTNTDIHEAKEIEQQLADLNATLERRVNERTAQLFQAEEALRHSHKMEAVGQLTGGLAHDFNNLLAGISASLELLQTRLEQGRVADAGRYVMTAQSGAKRAAALTHRLLAFSRRQTLDPKPTSVNRLISNMEELVRRTIGPHILFETVLAVGLWSTLVDQNQLENAILNLSINARDAMPDGGRLTIETSNRWLDERVAREQDLSPGQFISICVSDTGTGMAKEVIARAFDPFFTTKPIGEGTGLGLSMVYGFARQSGGQVRIYSEVGQGTMVCIYLPRHLREEDIEEPPPRILEPLIGASDHTILVIDDEPSIRMLIVEALCELGYSALEAQDGPSAMKVLQSVTKLDLLITDVGLPGGMNGRQVADAARVRLPELKVLFITGYAENAVLNHEHLEHGMKVLTKPFAIEALASQVRELLGNASAER